MRKALAHKPIVLAEPNDGRWALICMGWSEDLLLQRGSVQNLFLGGEPPKTGGRLLETTGCPVAPGDLVTPFFEGGIDLVKRFGLFVGQSNQEADFGWCSVFVILHKLVGLGCASLFQDPQRPSNGLLSGLFRVFSFGRCCLRRFSDWDGGFNMLKTIRVDEG